MLTINRMNRRQSFAWLWRNDPEAKWYWLRRFLSGHNCKQDVQINIRDFGVCSKR